MPWPHARRPRSVLEIADQRTFASAVDWPGWCRSGRTPDEALGALADYARGTPPWPGWRRVRFAVAAGDELTVVEPGRRATRPRPSARPTCRSPTDRRDLTAAEADRQVRLLRARLAELDRLAVEAPEQLRKGPRGGGRDRDKVVAHVIEAERSYARKIGVRHPPFHGDPRRVGACRAEIEQVLRAARSGEPMRERLAGPLLPAPSGLARARPRLGDRGQVRAGKPGCEAARGLTP